MNYRDFYKSNTSTWKKYLHLLPEGVDPKEFEMGFKDEYEEHPQVGPEGAAKIAVQHLKKNPKHYTISQKAGLEEKELIKGINLEAGAGDEDFPRREDGALNTVHDGRPIHLSKIIQVGAEFGNGLASGETSGYTNIGVQSKSQGKDQSKDKGGIKVTQDGDTEPITAGGKEVGDDLATKSVGGEVTGGQEQGGPNTVGSIAGTPKIGGETEGGEEAMTLSLQEAKSKLRNMVKEVLKEITFDKEAGKWVRLNEADKVDMKMGPSYKAPAGRQYKTSDDDQARKVEYEPEITEVHDEEEEESLYERYSELANAKRNLSESELGELRDLGMKLGKINEAKVDMKMGPSYKVVQPTLAKTSEPDQFSRTNQYDPEVSESAEEEEECMDEAKKKKFLQKAIKKSHKGYCTPMTKPTCTPRRKALARRLKPGGDLYKGGKEEQEESRDDAKVMEPHFSDDWKEEQDEVAPPGWEGTVKAMKKHRDIDNPWALAHWMKGKGMTSHKEEEEESMDEAGGGAVQHSSFRTAQDMPQIPKNRHRGDIDEAKKKA